MTSRKMRNFLFRLHAWIGLNLSVLLLLMLATGTTLVFITEIEAFLHKDMRATSAITQRSATPGAIYDNVRAAYPDVSTGWIERDKASWIGDATVVFTRWGEEVFVWTDPVTAEVLGSTPRLSGLNPIIRGIHDSLLTGHRLGVLLVSSASVFLLISIITGLISYRRFWRGYFRPPPRHMGTRGWWGGLHRLTVLWALPFLIVITLTGLFYFITAIGVPSGTYPKAAEASERAGRLPAGFSGANLDRAAAAATAAMPELEITLIVLPNRTTDGIKFQGRTDALLAEAKANSVTVDPTTFQVLGAFSAGDLSLWSRVTAMIHPLHFGQWGGFASRVLWLIFGVLSTGAALFGALVYASRVLPPAPSGAAPSSGVARRIWTGMSPTKWLMVLLIIGTAALGAYRFGPINEKWVRQWVPAQPHEAQLWTRGKLRSGEEIQMRFQLKADGSAHQATVQLGDSTAETVRFEKDGEVLVTTAKLRADHTDNQVILTLPDLGTKETRLIWRLGRPVL
ncbi:PepSY-associated TM helix domain-containing protein [Ruegeria meonggei]|uniref:PepSY-associated TM helix n=1 Tax=Ruegeria meonggei TaxID=1446476 RepID=A0A1X7AEQ0_9RHOB|nr:PepSY-associated TM helix domain-containing protein [Ruegeria meonggei]SLN75908.1 hypothetical protein RUM8411_04292 [Ruegeria meonggei]